VGEIRALDPVRSGLAKSGEQLRMLSRRSEDEYPFLRRTTHAAGSSREMRGRAGGARSMGWCGER
jgi:hypothetical protein